MAENLSNIVYVDTADFNCSKDLCDHKERTLSYALFVDIPQQAETPDAVFKECCYSHKVLADLNSAETYKNDFSGFFHKRQVSSETCDFVMIDTSTGTEYDLDNDTYGTFRNFNSISGLPNLKTFRLDWKKVLQGLGAGSYKILKRVGVVGVAVDIEYLVYNLYQYSSSLADNTARIDVTMDGYLRSIGVNFEGSGFETSLRVPGFFGRRNPKFEEDNLVNRGYVKRQISIKQTNEYKFQTNFIPVCLTSEIFDFLLMSDDIRISDYNLNNHSYYRFTAVSIEENAEPTYLPQTRKAQLNVTFSDKVVNKIRRS